MNKIEQKVKGAERIEAYAREVRAEALAEARREVNARQKERGSFFVLRLTKNGHPQHHSRAIKSGGSGYYQVLAYRSDGKRMPNNKGLECLLTTYSAEEAVKALFEWRSFYDEVEVETKRSMALLGH